MTEIAVNLSKTFSFSVIYFVMYNNLLNSPTYMDVLQRDWYATGEYLVASRTGVIFHIIAFDIDLIHDRLLHIENQQRIIE